VGDIILNFGGSPVPRSSALPPLVGRAEIGETVDVQVLRGGDRRTLKIKIGELPEEDEIRKATGRPGQVFVKRLAIEVADLSEEKRAQLNLDSGVQVIGVKEGPVSEVGVQEGDIILSINDTKIKDVKQFKELIEELPAGKTVPILLQRGQNTSFVAIKIPEDS
jgi:serine protease Do